MTLCHAVYRGCVMGVRVLYFFRFVTSVMTRVLWYGVL